MREAAFLEYEKWFLARDPNLTTMWLENIIPKTPLVRDILLLCMIWPMYVHKADDHFSSGHNEAASTAHEQEITDGLNCIKRDPE